jgi:hypothetical protein
MELIIDDKFFEDLSIDPGFITTYNETMALGLLKFTWNGSDIGPIDGSIYSCQKSEDDHILHLWTKNSKDQPKLIPVKILKYKNEIPIIIDECKPLFGLKKVGKHKAMIRGIPIVIIRYQGDISLKRYLNDMLLTPEKTGKYFLEEIRKVFVFRWLMCLNNNWENTIEVRTGAGINYPISCRENTFNYDAASLSTRIPRTIINTWFEGKDDLVDSSIESLIKDRDLSVLRFEIQKIINKFDKQLISWNNGIFDKILYASNTTKEEFSLPENF